LLEQTHKQFLDEKENSCACLLEVIARQNKEAELARSQLDLFKERNGEENGGVKEMETRLNLATSALHETVSDQQSSMMSPGRSKQKMEIPVKLPWITCCWSRG
jgi:hypothetical protein